MGAGKMRKIRRTAFAWIGRLHIWIGWLVAVPLLLWTVSGLFMVSQPIETVRGEHLKTKLEIFARPVPNCACLPMLESRFAPQG